MTQFSTRFVLPEVLYHGTVMGAILNPSGFRSTLINHGFMQTERSKNRDFGTGFYTTVDFRQAAMWARKSILTSYRLGVRDFDEQDLPAIISIRSILVDVRNPVDVLDFRGESANWANFILAHRNRSSLNDCDCVAVFGQPHPKIVCGPMADNDTGHVISDFKINGRLVDRAEDQQWFREQITHSEDGVRRLGLELGDQVAWFGEDMNTFLAYDGYHKINISRFLGDNVNEKNYREEWDFYGDR